MKDKKSESNDKVDLMKKQFSMINLKRRNMGSSGIKAQSIKKVNDVRDSNQRSLSNPKVKLHEIERKNVENPPHIGVKRIFQDSNNKITDKQEENKEN